MNLLTDCWLPIIRRDGKREKVAIWELFDEYESNPIIDLESPRPDFRNALYQLLIGIVQVAAAPEDEEVWAELWEEPYSPNEFKEKVLEYADCFEIDSEGPAFMQDYDSELLQKNKPVSIFRLVMGSPGDNTVKENRDFFIKEKDNFELDVYWAAVALYVTQTTGPPDGGGHRAGLRGSGPLTTLIVPVSHSIETTIWEKLWLNILPQEETNPWNGNPKKEIFPWMNNTISSAGDKTTTFKDLHPLSIYWGMPWRVRFVLPSQEGICLLTGMHSENTINQHRRLKHGFMYSNLWTHPFTPHLCVIPEEYKNGGEKENKKIAMLATSDNFFYRNWSTLCLGDKKYNRSKIVDYFLSNRLQRICDGNGLSFQLWASGFHMVPGKATVVNWNEAIMPIMPVDADSEQKVRDRSEVLTNQSSELANALHFAVKEAWFSRPKDAKGDVSFLSNSFWQNTEPDFYQLLDRMVKHIDDVNVWAECARQWRDRISREVYTLFDQWALAQQEDGLDMRRIVKARGRLEKEVGKVYKELNNYIVVE